MTRDGDDCTEWVVLEGVEDIDRLTPGAWYTIDTNYGECTGDTTGCAGLLSGREVWTPDDLRAVARASERLADFQADQGEAERAAWTAKRARALYEWADELEAGKREPPHPQGPPS